MTFPQYLRTKHGHIVNLYVKGMSEHVAEHEGRMSITGRLSVESDHVVVTTVQGDTCALRIEDVICVDWSAEDQIEIEHISPYDFE